MKKILFLYPINVISQPPINNLKNVFRYDITFKLKFENNTTSKMRELKPRPWSGTKVNLNIAFVVFSITICEVIV